MRGRSNLWAKLAARGRFRTEAKLVSGGKDYTTISAPIIVRKLMAQPMAVGSCIAATLSVSVLTPDRIESPVKIMARITDDEAYSEWASFGTFFINQRDDSQHNGLVTLDCYDAMLMANTPYLTSADDALVWPRPMIDVVEDIAARLEVGIDPRTKINTGADYMIPKPSADKTMQSLLVDIAICHGGNWIITEDNLLRLIPLTSAADETYRLIDEDFNVIKAADGSAIVYKDGGATVISADDSGGETPESPIVASYHITDEHGNSIITPQGYYLAWSNGEVVPADGVLNVPVVCGGLTTGTSVTLSGISATAGNNTLGAGNNSGYVLDISSDCLTQNIVNDLYERLKGITYSPFTASKTIFDPAAELGDKVIIGDAVRSVLCVETLTFDIDFRADLNAPNSEELSVEYPYKKEYQKLQQSLASLDKSVNKSIDDLTDKVNSGSGETGTLAAQLEAEIIRAGQAELALSDQIKAEKDRAEKTEKQILEDVAAGYTTKGELSDAQTAVDQKFTDVHTEIEGIKSKLDIMGPYKMVGGRLCFVTKKKA